MLDTKIIYDFKRLHKKQKIKPKQKHTQLKPDLTIIIIIIIIFYFILEKNI